VMNVSVCLYACLSAVHISETACPISTKFLRMLWSCPGTPLTAWRYVMYFRFYDDVTKSEPLQRRTAPSHSVNEQTRLLRVTTRWRSAGETSFRRSSYVISFFYPACSPSHSDTASIGLASLTHFCTTPPASTVCSAASVTYYIRSGRPSRADVIVQRN